MDVEAVMAELVDNSERDRKRGRGRRAAIGTLFVPSGRTIISHQGRLLLQNYGDDNFIHHTDSSRQAKAQ